MLIRPVFPAYSTSEAAFFPFFPSPAPGEPQVRGEALDNRFPPLTGPSWGDAPPEAPPGPVRTLIRPEISAWDGGSDRRSAGFDAPPKVWRTGVDERGTFRR